jgi:uncharacterized membrane protein
MRMRDFRWSTDIVVPAAFGLVFVWGLVGGSPQVAFLAGAAFAIQVLYIVRRVERLQSDGSYRRLVSAARYKWIDPASLVFGLVGGITIISATLLLSGHGLLLSLVTAAAFAVLWTLAIAAFRRALSR